MISLAQDSIRGASGVFLPFVYLRTRVSVLVVSIPIVDQQFSIGPTAAVMRPEANPGIRPSG